MHEYPPVLDTWIAGQYYLEDQLGMGGYGCVMRARDKSDKRVAIKFFDTSDEDWRRFAREVEAMRAVEHPNVVTVLAANMEHQPPYFVMPIADTTLARWAESNRAKQRDLMQRILDVCDGLHALHSAGLVHRDVKPTNMLVYGTKTVVSDLGLARILTADASKLTRSTTIIGTEEYQAHHEHPRFLAFAV